MILRHRTVILIVLSAIAIVGIGAGIKLQQIEDQSRESPSAEAIPYAPVKRVLKTDKSFFTSATSTKPSAIAKKIPAQVVPAAPTDGIAAEAYIVGDLDTGKIYFERGADKVLPFASMSKLITALVATNMYPSDTAITITPEEADVAPDLSGIKAGETFTAKELIYPLLLTSSNIAAEAFASSTDRIEFLSLMSGYSWEIGMPHAYFADPSGISPQNAGTARGFFAMARYLYKSRKDILAITRTVNYSIATTTGHDAHAIVNIHPFVSDPRFLGGKTGHTSAALDTMLTILNMQDHPIAFIVLRSPDYRTQDTDALIGKMEQTSF